MRIWSNLLKKSLMENLIFYAVRPTHNSFLTIMNIHYGQCWQSFRYNWGSQVCFQFSQCRKLLSHLQDENGSVQATFNRRNKFADLPWSHCFFENAKDAGLVKNRKVLSTTSAPDQSPHGCETFPYIDMSHRTTDCRMFHYIKLKQLHKEASLHIQKACWTENLILILTYQAEVLPGARW